MCSWSAKTRIKFNLRAFVTLVTTLVFAVMMLSGVILYLAPRGRVANWTHWSVLGLEKEQWSDLHMVAAVLLVVVIAFHLAYNWRPLCNYLRDRTSRLGMQWRELTVATAVVLLVAVGALAGLPPFSAVLSANESIKDAWETRVGTVRRAPSTYVQQVSVSQFAQRMGLPLEAVQQALRAHGIVTDDPHASMDTLARQHGVHLQHIYETAVAGVDQADLDRVGRAAEGDLGGGAGTGGGGRYGQMTLSAFCEAEHLPMPDVLWTLQMKGVQATGTSRLRELADQCGTTPRHLADQLAGRD